MTGSSNSATAAQIRVPAMLRPTVGGERIVSAEGATLRELIAQRRQAPPRLRRPAARDGTGAQRRFVNIYVNDDDVRYLKGLDTPVDAGDVISILPAVAGGR